MILNKEERLSSAWLKIKSRLEDRLSGLRMQNDGDRNVTDTANIRGRISEIKRMLAEFGEDQAPPIGDE